MGLISLDVRGPTDADIPAARLGGAPGLIALREPVATDARLDLQPRHVVQQDAPETWASRFRRETVVSLGTIAVHVGFAATFLALLTWRPEPPQQENEIPIEVVARMPDPPRPPDPPKPAPKPQPEVKKAEATAIPSPPKLDPPTPPSPEAPPRPQAPAPPPPLVAAPPDAASAATQDRESKTANLEPDRQTPDQATHEARPADVPRVLTTPDQSAGFAVAPRVEPKPDPKPSPAAPAKVQSETDKLAAALPMDISAMPLTFRAVLSGHGAEISAAYKGVVYGRFNRTPEVGERARRQHLKGQVIVAFTIDGGGQVTNLTVLQSSGNAAVDALGLEIVRAGAPYPPPPPEAERSFTPAFAFGE